MGLFGAYEHFSTNLAFELEIRPHAAVSEVCVDALMGASPLLAPGILGFGAVLALGAVWPFTQKE